MKCPICKNGILPDPRSKTRRVVTKTIMARLLREAGYSLREIGAFLGYKSPRSVQLCLERKSFHEKDNHLGLATACRHAKCKAELPQAVVERVHEIRKALA